jgi:hypothetical protein
MKKILVMLCAIVVCLFAACVNVCGFPDGDANTTYTWSYSNNGTTGRVNSQRTSTDRAPSTCRMAPTAVR